MVVVDELYVARFFSTLFCDSVSPACVLVSTELVQELSKTKRVRIAEEVILEDESKPKKKKK